MSKLEEFKEFVKRNPELVKYVKNDEMTWQKFYEMYDLYGEEEDIWKDYRTVSESTKAATTTTGFDFMNWLKNIDIDAFQENINSVKRVVGVLQDLNTNNNTTGGTSSEYKPRPIYKHFED